MSDVRVLQKRSFEFEMMSWWIFTSFTNTIVKAVACGKDELVDFY